MVCPSSVEGVGLFDSDPSETSTRANDNTPPPSTTTQSESIDVSDYHESNITKGTSNVVKRLGYGSESPVESSSQTRAIATVGPNKEMKLLAVALEVKAFRVLVHVHCRRWALLSLTFMTLLLAIAS